MSMAIARSVLARAARGRHTASQPLVPARAALEPSLPSAGWMMQRNTTANTVGKRPHTLFFHLHSYLFIGIVDGGFCSRVSSSPSLDDDFAPLVLSDWQNVVSSS
jgi:hypothetical protein